MTARARLRLVSVGLVTLAVLSALVGLFWPAALVSFLTGRP